MNHWTNQKACWIMKPLSAMDPPDVEGRDGGRDAKRRPWQLRRPVILLLVITLPTVLDHHYSLNKFWEAKDAEDDDEDGCILQRKYLAITF